MSGIIGAALTTTILVLPDKRLLADEWVGLDIAQPPIMVAMTRDNSDCYGIADFRTPWWPAPSGMIGDGGVGDVLDSVCYQLPWTISGANGRLGFNGIARDAFNSPLPFATIRLFRTSSGELTAQVTADGNGAYIATTPYNDAHFLTIHAAGVGGSSVDTLIPG